MSETSVVWFSRILRWVFGALFTGVGILYFDEGGWPAILFGAAFLVSGFFRPRRCIDDGCTVPTDRKR